MSTPIILPIEGFFAEKTLKSRFILGCITYTLLRAAYKYNYCKIVFYKIGKMQSSRLWVRSGGGEEKNRVRQKIPRRY